MNEKVFIINLMKILVKKKMIEFQQRDFKAYPTEMDAVNLRRGSPSKDGYDDWEGGTGRRKNLDKSLIAHLPVDLLERV